MLLLFLAHYLFVSFPFLLSQLLVGEPGRCVILLGALSCGRYRLVAMSIAVTIPMCALSILSLFVLLVFCWPSCVFRCVFPWVACRGFCVNSLVGFSLRLFILALWVAGLLLFLFFVLY